MEPRAGVLRLYTQPSDAEPLTWEWVESQLRSAGTYWVVAATPGTPHPRPVWGVWHDDQVMLSVGSPALGRQLTVDAPVTVHLDSGVDVVIVEGVVLGPSSDPEALAAYDEKYDWDYDLDTYGPLTAIGPVAVKAWRSSGPAGREGFSHAGRWTF